MLTILKKVTLYISVFFILFFFGLFNPHTIFAADPPTLLLPENNSTVSSSSLSWQTPSYSLYSSSPYRVQVDDDSFFSSIDKDYYTANTFYTPTLTTGSWYWRVKAKDASGTWSDWSSRQFILSTSTPSPSPTAVATSSPTSTPTPSPSPSAQLTFSSLPSKISSNQSFSLTVQLNNFASNSQYFLKGAFVKSGSSNYFGETKVSNSWIKNNATYSSQYSITTNSSGSWSGDITFSPDSSDSGFSGSGDYIFKIARYNSSGSGPTWSNESTINITAVESTPTTSPSPSSTTSVKLTSSKTENIPSTSISEENKISYQLPDLSSGDSSVAAVQISPSPDILQTPAKKFNFTYIIASLIFATISGGCLVYYVKTR